MRQTVLMFIFSLWALTSFAQNREFSGTIFNNRNEPLEGVSIVEKSNKAVAVTNKAGFFTLKLVADSAAVTISYVGFANLDTVLQNGIPIILMLQEKVNDLEDVVVVGFGQQKKIAVTGAISSISTKELKQSPASNLSQAMAGRLPGLIAVQPSGDPGRDAANLLIRGQGTFNNASPLVLVDGVERPFNTIDPNEVETISILKDASSTAVFGVRGANGVILVTTRRGAVGKPVVSGTFNYASQQPTRLSKFLGAYEYSLLANEAKRNETPTGQNYTPIFSDADLEIYKNRTGDPYIYPDIDYFEEFLRPSAPQYNANINVSGGTRLAKYFVSGSYFRQDGLLKHLNDKDFDARIKYDRYNFRSNVDLDVNKDLRVSVNLAARGETRNGPYASTETLFSYLMTAPPNMSPLVNPDGTYNLGSNSFNVRQANPLANFQAFGVTKDYKNIMEGSVQLKQNLTFVARGLSFRTNLNFTNEYNHGVSRFRGSDGNNFYLKYTLAKDAQGNYVYGQAAGGPDVPTLSYSQNLSGTNSYRTIYYEAALDYVRNFNKHAVTGLLLFNRSRRVKNSSGWDWPFSYEGLVGRVTYGFDSKYFIDFNMGYNGSENFPEGNRYGFFPSASANWVISNEKFLSGTSTWLELLKFRGSYGLVGNDKYGDEANAADRFLFYNSSFASSGSYAFGLTNSNSVTGYIEGALGNPSVTWEVAKKSNIGIDARFFKGIIALTADVFYERRNNILRRPGTIPATMGQTLPVLNLGEVENKGYELELTHNHTIGAFSYYIKGNYNFARNKMLFLDEPLARYPWMRSTGQPVGVRFGYEVAGFFNNQQEIDNWARSSHDPGPFGKLQPGDFKYVDQNDDGVIDAYDRVPIGFPSAPQRTYGGAFGFSYKGFDMSILFQGAARASMYVTLEAGWEFFNKAKVMDIHLGRWTPETAATATYPRLSLSPAATHHNYQNSDYWLKDAGFVRLKQAEIGYTLPQSIIEKLKIKSIRIYTNGLNLHTWSEIKYLDPENRQDRAWFYPQQRVINAGVNVNF